MTSENGATARPSDLDLAVQGVLKPLADEQQRIVNLVSDTFFKFDAKWPTFQFVEAAFDAERLDAKSVIASFPTVGGGGIRYGAVASIAWAGNLRPEQPIELTALGLSHYSGTFKSQTEALVRDLFRVLAMFIERRRTFRPSPTELTNLTLTSEQVLTGLRDSVDGLPSASQLYRLMEHEPAFYVGGRGAPDSEASSWYWNVDRQVLAYEGVRDVPEYVRRIAVEYAVPPLTRNQVLVSPRSLPSALDYLDTVWRLAHGREVHLVRLPSAERTMALGYEAGTREEFLERTSTLGDLLKSLVVPRGGEQRGGHSVERLGAYLRSKLPPESHERVANAIAMLNHIRVVRNAGSHAEAEPEALTAYRAMGIEYPVLNWGNAWDAVRIHAVGAFDALREELMALAETDENAP
jgi:hypothetical protein